MAVLIRERGVNAGEIIDIALPAHVPFTEVAGRVTRALQRPGEHRRLGIQPLRHAALLVVLPVVEKRGDPPALRVVPGRDGGARRRADR